MRGRESSGRIGNLPAMQLVGKQRRNIKLAILYFVQELPSNQNVKPEWRSVKKHPARALTPAVFCEPVIGDVISAGFFVP